MKIRKFFDDFKLDVSVNYVLKVEYQTIEGDLETKNGRMNLSDEEREDIRLDIQDLKIGALSKERIERLGLRLYRLLFPGEIASELGIAIERVNQDPDRSLGLRVVISYPEKSEIAEWPLELLYCPNSGGIWLSTDPRMTLSRKIVLESQRYRRGNKTPPLKIMVVVSSPTDLGPVMSGKVLDAIVNLVRASDQPDASPGQSQRLPSRPLVGSGSGAARSARIEVKVLGIVEDFDIPSEEEMYLGLPATSEEFTALIEEWNPQILHFIGHGEIREGAGCLAFVHPITHNAEWVPAGNLVQRLHAAELTLRLVVLQACKSAESQLSLASRLISLNIPAVVAMQFEIENHTAAAFASCFYDALSRQAEIDHAVQLARSSITQVRDPKTGMPLNWESGQFCTPVLFSFRPAVIIDPILLSAQEMPPRQVMTVSSGQVAAAMTDEEKLSQYMDDEVRYRSQGDTDMADLIKKKIDGIKAPLLARLPRI